MILDIINHNSTALSLRPSSATQPSSRSRSHAARSTLNNKQYVRYLPVEWEVLWYRGKYHDPRALLEDHGTGTRDGQHEVPGRSLSGHSYTYDL